MEKRGEEAEEREDEKASPSPFPLPGDLLEDVLRHLPTVDLVPALYVSTAWQSAALTSLRRTPLFNPWLFLHAQSRRTPGAVATHAYDPNSRVWLRVPQGAGAPRDPPLSSALRSSPGCGLLYELTPCGLAVCTGGLGAAWRVLGAPIAWRTDPVVAAVGGHVLVAGGTCGFFDDNPCAVELHRADGAVTACEPMPGDFSASASATFLSVSASDRKMYTMERSTGLICSFDVETGAWGAMAELRPHPSLYSSAIAFSGHRLLLAGIGREGKNAASLRLWAVDGDTFECDELGIMPAEMLGRLAGGDGASFLTSVDISAVGDFAYVYKPSHPTVVVSCDFAGGECRWTNVEALKEVEENPMDRYVLTCSTVRMDDLRVAFWPAVGRGVTGGEGGS